MEKSFGEAEGVGRKANVPGKTHTSSLNNHEGSTEHIQGSAQGSLCIILKT